MVTVIVTIHGIGFQVPPNDAQGIEGYADAFHRHLRETTALGDALGDDPERLKDGVQGPVYVHSQWPPGSKNIELGIKRLGTWIPGKHPAVVTTDQKLVDGTQPLAHVALVYANLEEKISALGPLGLITEMALFRLGNYSSVPRLVRMLWLDALPLLKPGKAQPTPSLQPRRVVRLPTPTSPDQPTINIVPEPTGARATIVQLENDVAAYVTRDTLRQRVRSFVTECLLRLAYRPDVDGIIVNSHSQGTVVAFDAVRDFPVVAKDCIKALVTAGSPLRKYVDLFAWGHEIGCIYGIDGENGPWRNFWDKRDPVADPLEASAHWQPGQAADPVAGDELFVAYKRDTGERLLYTRLKDVPTDNLKFSYGGGLQAHNYWDNQREFIPPFVEVVRSAAGLVK
jgi:hypothetical protein